MMGFVQVIDTSDGSRMTRIISPVVVGTIEVVNFVKVMLSQSGKKLVDTIYTDYLVYVQQSNDEG